jgi:hypothetical protein
MSEFAVRSTLDMWILPITREGLKGYIYVGMDPLGPV